MTIWKIGVYRPIAGEADGSSGGFEGPDTGYEYTGLEYDDSQIVKSWTPSSAAGAAYPASSAAIQVQRIIEQMQQAFDNAGGGLGAGWLYCADNQAGLIVFPNRPVANTTVSPAGSPNG